MPIQILSSLDLTRLFRSTLKNRCCTRFFNVAIGKKESAEVLKIHVRRVNMVIHQESCHQVMSVAGLRRLFPDFVRLQLSAHMDKATNPESNVARMELAESGVYAKALFSHRFICASSVPASYRQENRNTIHYNDHSDSC